MSLALVFLKLLRLVLSLYRIYNHITDIIFDELVGATTIFFYNIKNLWKFKQNPLPF